MADEKVLSYADIDAMVSTSVPEEVLSGTAGEPTQQPATPADETKTAPKAKAAPAGKAKSAPASPSSHEVPHMPASPNDIESLRAILVDLAKRIAKIEAAMVKSKQLEKTIAEAKAMANQPPKDFQAMADQLEELSEQVQGILEKLQSTAGYDIGKAFRCNSCYSQGMVAIRVKCTECGRENWWGWWPEKSS